MGPVNRKGRDVEKSNKIYENGCRIIVSFLNNLSTLFKRLRLIETKKLEKDSGLHFEHLLLDQQWGFAVLKKKKHVCSVVAP